MDKDKDSLSDPEITHGENKPKLPDLEAAFAKRLKRDKCTMEIGNKKKS